MSVSNFVRTTIKNSVSSGATTIDVDTASSPFKNPPSSGRGFMVDSLDSPTKWEEVTWTGRSAITGGYQLTGVSRNEDSNTGSPQSFDAGHYFIQSVSGTTKVVTDEAQTFTALQTFSSGISFGNETLSAFRQAQTWTPTLEGLTTAGSPSYSAQVGRYSRVGDVVFARFYISLTVDDSWAGDAVIKGLPIAAVSGTNRAGVCSFNDITRWDFGDYPIGRIDSGESQIRLLRSISGTTAGEGVTDVDTHLGADGTALQLGGIAIYNV